MSRCKAMNGRSALTDGRQDSRTPDPRNRSFLASVPPDHLHAAHIGLKDVGDGDRAVLLLISLHHCDQRAAERGARAVQRVDETRLAVRTARARIHAAGLEIAADRAARDLAECPALALAGHPDF